MTLEEKIENFILKNIHDFSKIDSLCNGTYYKFTHKKNGISLIPNIEELFSAITSNFDSNKITIYFDNTILYIYSAIIVNKLKEKIKDKLEIKEIEYNLNFEPTYDENYDRKEIFLRRFINKK